MRDIEALTLNVAVALLAATLGCASTRSGPPAASFDPASDPGGTAGVTPGARDANLAGARCGHADARGLRAPCACRSRSGDPAEDPPPDAAHKRFEIRLSADDGSAILDSPTLGHLTAGDAEACFYVDVLSGTTSDLVFTAKERAAGQGVGPHLEIAEYGLRGPWWYKIVDVSCAGPQGKCDREAADDWGKQFKTRSRGRLDPCGSTVVTRLGWDTTGGTAKAELALFRDFTVRFAMEVKRFATQFAPGSTECVPK